MNSSRRSISCIRKSIVVRTLLLIVVMCPLSGAAGKADDRPSVVESAAPVAPLSGGVASGIIERLAANRTGAASLTRRPLHDDGWAAGFHWSGDSKVGNWVFTAAEFDGKLVLGGLIDWFGNAYARNIVMWDGDRYESLDTGLNWIPGRSIEYDSRLIVGSYSGPIAAWDGSHWELLERAGSISDMCVYGDRLYIAGVLSAPGQDTIRSLAAWDGAHWQDLSATLKGPVRCLTTFDGRLVAGGTLSEAGGQPISHVAAWNDDHWAPLGAGLPGPVTVLDAFSGRLVAIGNFAGGSIASDVAVFDGTSWEIYDGTWPSDVAIARVVHDTLFARGSRDVPVIYWNGTDWDDLGGGDHGEVMAMVDWQDRLTVCGRFASPKARYEWCLAYRDAGVWRHPSGLGLGAAWTSAQAVYDMTVFRGELIAAGLFESAGDNESNGIAAFDGKNWRDMSPPGTACAMQLLVNRGTLYTRGIFDRFGGSLVDGIARWDGSDWQFLPDLPSVDRIGIFERQLVAHTDDRLVAWDGNSWQLLSDGIGAHVSDMEVYDGRLILAGSFEFAGSEPVNGIAAWDGSAWSSLGGGFTPPYFTITLYTRDGCLYASGDFAEVGGVAGQGWACWDGYHWTAVGSGLSPARNSIILDAIEYQGHLVVGGDFDAIDGVPARNIAISDGDSWRPLGEGVFNVLDWSTLAPDADASVHSLVRYRSSLYAGGDFSVAGDKISVNIGKWNMPRGSDPFYLAKPDAENTTDESAVLTKAGNFPNPFNPSTGIRFTLGRTARVTVEILNVLGQRVTTLVDRNLQAGDHVVVWDGKSESGAEVASGVYFYTISTDNARVSRKMLLLR